jgi:hypothetical protein
MSSLATNIENKCAQYSDLSAPIAKDAEGNEITSANVSQLVIIFSTFSNPCYFDQRIVIATEVRDQDDATVFFQYAPVRAGAFNSSEVGALWTPENEGRYELRSFAFSNSSTSQILTELQTCELIVVDYYLVETRLPTQQHFGTFTT